MINVKVSGLEAVREKIRVATAKKLDRIAVRAYEFARVKTYVRTGFLQSNWRVSLGEKNIKQYGQAIRVSIDPPEWDILSVDKSVKYFFNTADYNFQNLHISNSAEYASIYNRAVFRAAHSGLVLDIHRYITEYARFL